MLHVLFTSFFGHTSRRERDPQGLLIMIWKGDFEFDQLLGQPYFSPIGYYKFASVALALGINRDISFCILVLIQSFHYNI